MKNSFYYLGLLAVLPLSLALRAGSQPNGTVSTSTEVAKHAQAVELLRAINTAEANNKLMCGAYVTWEALMANGDFNASGSKWLSKSDPRFSQLKFSGGPEIVPGWSLRLKVSEAGKAYDLVLEDLRDERCGYAAITDERGVIRQGKAIDCEI